MEKKTLAELIIDPMIDIIDFEIFEDPKLTEFKKDVLLKGLEGSNIELFKLKKEIKEMVKCDMPYFAIMPDLIGPNSEFILHIDARDKVDNEYLAETFIGTWIVRELTHNIVKEFKKCYEDKKYPFISYIGIQKLNEFTDSGEKEYFVFDFADTGAGLADSIADIKLRCRAAEQVLKREDISPEEKKKLDEETFDADAREAIKTQKLNIDEILKKYAGPKREKGKKGKLGFYSLYRIAKKLGGSFEINYSIFDHIVSLEWKWYNYSPFEESTNSNIIPNKYLQEYLDNRMKTHIRVKIPCSAIIDDFSDIAQRQSQKFQRTSFGGFLDNNSAVDELIKSDDEDKKKRTDHLQDYWK